MHDAAYYEQIMLGEAEHPDPLELVDGLPEKPAPDLLTLCLRAVRQTVTGNGHDGLALKALRPTLMDQLRKRGCTNAADLADEALGLGDAAEHQVDGDDQERRKSQAETLVDLALARSELFQDANGDTFASFVVDEHRETWPVRSKGFRRWLVDRYMEEHDGRVPGGQARADALEAIDARAARSQVLPVAIRVAEVGGSVFVDLCNERWEAVEIQPTGWAVVATPPVRFRRAPGMLPLPAPVAGGSVDLLRPFVNVASGDGFKLLVAWLVMAFSPRGPYPVLALQGEQGSAKSFATRLVKRLVDPSTAETKSTPREDRELAIAARNAWALAYDNVSTLPAWLSDAFCRLATGGGFSCRKLFTDAEEELFDFVRPLILNGITDVATRPDLSDRAVILHLEAIPEERRRDEKELLRTFDSVRPRILGALCTAVQAALAHVEEVKLVRLPRMADFARWVTAAEVGLGWDPGSFVEIYSGARQEAAEEALGADVVAQGVQLILRDDDSWQGTASDLLDALVKALNPSGSSRLPKDLPTSGRGVRERLQRLAPLLRSVGIEVSYPQRTKRTRGIRLDRVGKQPSPPSPLSPTTRKQQEQGQIAFPAMGDGPPRRGDGGDGPGDGGDGPPRARHTTVTPGNTATSTLGDEGDEGDGRLPLPSKSSPGGRQPAPSVLTATGAQRSQVMDRWEAHLRLCPTCKRSMWASGEGLCAVASGLWQTVRGSQG